jgi:hypothetical protein
MEMYNYQRRKAADSIFQSFWGFFFPLIFSNFKQIPTGRPMRMSDELTDALVSEAI